MTNEDKNQLVPKRQDQVEPGETQNPEELQQVFEKLLMQYRANGGKLVERVLPFSDGLAAKLEQKLFVRPRSDKKDIPDVGLALVAPQANAEYRAGFFVSPGHPVQPGITVGELHFEIRGEGRGVSAPGDFFGVRGVDLSAKYDAVIIQATANVFQRPILHSLQAQYGSRRMNELKQQGYNPRQNYPETLDRIYQSQMPSFRVIR